jgi:hypothetical protein
VKKSMTHISRRDVLIGGAVAVAVGGSPSRLLPLNPSLQALQHRKNKLGERIA